MYGACSMHVEGRDMHVTMLSPCTEVCGYTKDEGLVSRGRGDVGVVALPQKIVPKWWHILQCM